MSFDPDTELARYRAQLLELEQGAETLRELIAVLESKRRAVVRGTKGSGKSYAATIAGARGIDLIPNRPQGGRRGAAQGGKSLRDVLTEVMSDGVPRSVNDVIGAVRVGGYFTPEDFPARASFTNRLSDLREDGYLRQVARGVNVLASASPKGSAESVDAEGTEQPNPPGVLPGQGEGLGSGPAEGLDQPPGRDPDSGATAGAAGQG